MEAEAYQQYESESGNWLYRGRIRLLDLLLAEASRDRDDPANRRALEVGAGVGQNLPVLARYARVDAAEIDSQGLSRLAELDFVEHTYRDPIPFQLRTQYDIVCALDVLEHLEDDRGAVRWLVDGLQPGGHLVVSVPAYQWLFGSHDVALGHHRRYTRKQVKALVPADVEILRLGYFNTTVFPLVVLSRLVRRLRPSSGGAAQKQRSNVPEPIDRALGALLVLEAKLHARAAVAPFGVSVFMLARKRS